MKKYVLFVALVAAIGAVCWDLGRRGARAYERVLEQRIQNGFDVLGIRWARVEANGLSVFLRGHAPDKKSRTLALESAQASASIATIRSYATATLAPPDNRGPIRVEIHRDSGGITLIGQTASRAMRARLNDALVDRNPGVEVRDLTGIQAAQAPPGWGAEMNVAIHAASALPSAYVVMQPQQVSVEAEAEDERERDRLTRDLLERGQGRVAVVLRLNTPDRVIAPFTFSVQKDAGAGLRVESCAVRNIEEQVAVAGILSTSSTEQGRDTCAVGLGGPTGDWVGAIDAGLGALGKIASGRLEISYHGVRLIGYPPTSPSEFSTVEKSLIDALPGDFTGSAELRSDDALTRRGLGRTRYWMNLDLVDGNLVVRGSVPDPLAQTAIATYAAARHGRDAVTLELRQNTDLPPPGWQTAILKVIEAMARTNAAHATVVDGSLRMRGSVSGPLEAAKVHSGLLAALPDYSVRTDFRVDLAAQYAATVWPPARCAAELMDVVSANSIIFSTGSGAISRESIDVLDDLVETIGRCNDEPIEVGGHTDSHGSEELNLDLSQRRAEAVRDALIARGVAAERLVAKGYGEAQPIVGNDTEEGRARNRRIEFKPAHPGSDRGDP
ncbi:MAG: OmpA family protein [Pseudomonadota bacterium]